MCGADVQSTQLAHSVQCSDTVITCVLFVAVGCSKTSPPLLLVIAHVTDQRNAVSCSSGQLRNSSLTCWVRVSP